MESTDAGRETRGRVADQRRLLELQLIKVQNEATAARLAARAAEIELMLRRLDSDSTESPRLCLHSSTSETDASPALPDEARFRSWDQVREVLDNFLPGNLHKTRTDPAAPVESWHDIDGKPVHRIDPGQVKVKTPHIAPAREDAASIAIADDAELDESFGQLPSHVGALPQPDATDPLQPQSEPFEADVELAIDQQPEAKPDDRRGRPTAWLISAVAHLLVLLILAAITLHSQRPKDQVALSASAPEANELSMETFSIETEHPEPEDAEPTPSEMEYQLSPVSEVAAGDFAPDAPPAPPSPAASALSSSATVAAMSLKSDTDAKIQFCGVEGGGNHFVYLVDSSGSMGAGFESARAELLSSIEVLKPEQRFYVVFFDAQPDYMRLSNAEKDEPASVSATAENKAALKRWAMRIAMDRGRAPYEPLRFALQLKPDVIFLLSDGEFPQGIEDLLREENKVENLFGDRRPISIVHTIGYHSKEGESRMRRIAEQNQGQYRYIPEP